MFSALLLAAGLSGIGLSTGPASGAARSAPEWVERFRGVLNSGDAGVIRLFAAATGHARCFWPGVTR